MWILPERQNVESGWRSNFSSCYKMKIRQKNPLCCRYEKLFHTLKTKRRNGVGFDSLTVLSVADSSSFPGFQSEFSRWTLPRRSSSAEWCSAPGGSTFSRSKTSAAASSLCPFGGKEKVAMRWMLYLMETFWETTNTRKYELLRPWKSWQLLLLLYNYYGRDV